MADLTFVIPTHNRCELLKRCVDSALAQTVPIEIVIVDGGSTDGTKEYLATLPERVHVETLKRDPGPLTTWYVGAAAVQTEWIHFALDDDWCEPTFAERCLSAATGNVSAVVTDATIHFGDGRTQLNFRIGQNHITGPNASVSALLGMVFTITPSCAMLHRESVLDFLSPSRIPHVSARTFVADCYMMLGCLSRGPCAWISDPLVNLGAQESGFTMGELARDRDEALKKRYAEMKRAWTMNAAGYR